jgi:hypothetical protein
MKPKARVEINPLHDLLGTLGTIGPQNMLPHGGIVADRKERLP